nr:zinc finger, CCHC-type [Tanacetum cinerariifolium]
MRALLIQHGCEAALEVLPTDMEAQAKAELNKKAHNAVILCLGRKIFEHIDEFNKIVLDLANIEEKFEDENLALLLLTSLPASYKHFVNTLLYGREALTFEDGFTTVKRKDKIKISSGLIYDGSEVMMVISVEALQDWIMDSGGSYHMTPRLDLFFDFLECNGGRVLLGDNRECKIRRIGKVRVQLKDGSSFMLHNVRYIPELKRNLISLGTIKKERYTVKLQSGKIKVINCSRVVLSGTRRDNCVYSLDGHAVAGELNASIEEKDSLAQFRCRKAHYSRSDRLCSFRIMGSVSCGIIRRFKHEAFEKFKEWKQLVENQTGMTVKKLRTDNGLEFCNRKFKRLCIKSGIARHLTVVGTPQQIGLAERMNRTLMDKRLKKKTLMEMWLGHPSDYGMLRTFGCVAYSHVQQGADKSVEELQVEVELQRLNNHTLKEDQTDNEDQTNQDDGDDEDAGDQEIDQPPDLIDYQLVWDKEPRIRTKPLRFRDKRHMAAYAFAAAEEEDTHEPLTYQEAVACEDSSMWMAAMKEEMDSLRKNKTWELVDHQAKQKLVSYKWLFKIKEGIEGVQNSRYKARLVARRFTQRAGIDYNEVFLPVVRYTSIWVILALTACKDFELEQLDSPRQWYRRFDEYMLSNGFKRSSYDIYVYYKSYAPDDCLLVRDDMLIACKSEAESGSTKSLLKKESNMKDLGEAKKILGMEINRQWKSVQMPLGGHFMLSLKDYPVRDCDVERMSKVRYANAVGSLMYLMVCTRPDIAYAVSIVSRYLANPGKSHWEAVKWILKEVFEAKTVEFLKVGTEHNAADALTKVIVVIRSSNEVVANKLLHGRFISRQINRRHDPSHRNLFMRGIGWDTTTTTLKSVFEKYGEVEEGLVIGDKATNKSKGYDFFTFKHVDGAVKALVEPSKKIDVRITVARLASARGVANNNNVENRKVYVGNVPWEVGNDRLLECFAAFEEIEEGSLGFEKKSGRAKGSYVYQLLLQRSFHSGLSIVLLTQLFVDTYLVETLQEDKTQIRARSEVGMQVEVMCKMAVDGKKGRAGGGMMPSHGPVPGIVNTTQRGYADGGKYAPSFGYPTQPNMTPPGPRGPQAEVNRKMMSITNLKKHRRKRIQLTWNYIMIDHNPIKEHGLVECKAGQLSLAGA